MNLGAGEGRGPLLRVLRKGQAKLGMDVNWRRLTDCHKERRGSPWGGLGQPQVPDSPSPSESLGQKPASKGCRL